MRFDEFARARMPALLRHAYLLCGDRELAQDMVQEVLARALIHWHRISTTNEPGAYVRTMVTNEYLSFRRRKRVRQVALDHEALNTADDRAPDPSAHAGDRAELWQRMATLPRQQRAVLVLRYYEHLTDVEIAETLGCRPSTVRGYAARALATLRVSLSEDSVLSSHAGERA